MWMFLAYASLFIFSLMDVFHVVDVIYALFIRSMYIYIYHSRMDFFMQMVKLYGILVVLYAVLIISHLDIFHVEHIQVFIISHMDIIHVVGLFYGIFIYAVMYFSLPHGFVFSSGW